MHHVGNILYALVLYYSATCCVAVPTRLDSKGKTWALLAAGSRGYFNYRHQADVCHAYQLLKSNGFPEENIVTMMYDDIAHNSENPVKGTIINSPGGPDVYNGVKKDYTGENVTAQNFLNVLTGKKDLVKNIGSGRVIDSGPDDYVFVVFVDHGSSGALVFPDSDLHAADLYHTLHEMVENKKFKKMVLYIEACYSGSMFDNILEDNLDIFVMTAADPRESSYACYYDEYRKTYLGDLFSVNWIMEAEKENLSDASLNHVFEKVRTNTTLSHVEEYGDLDIGNTYASLFMKINEAKSDATKTYVNPNKDAVRSTDVPLEILKRRLMSVNSKSESDDIIKQIAKIRENRYKVDKIMKRILFEATGNDAQKVEELENTPHALSRSTMHCSKLLASTFSEKCLNISSNPYIGQKLYAIINMCNVDFINPEEAVEVIQKICSKMVPLTGVI